MGGSQPAGEFSSLLEGAAAPRLQRLPEPQGWDRASLTPLNIPISCMMAQYFLSQLPASPLTTPGPRESPAAWELGGGLCDKSNLGSPPPPARPSSGQEGVIGPHLSQSRWPVWGPQKQRGPRSGLNPDYLGLHFGISGGNGIKEPGSHEIPARNQPASAQASFSHLEGIPPLQSCQLCCLPPRSAGEGW